MSTSYNEVIYWNARTRPNATFLVESESEYISKHLKGCDDILDFGPGTGRVFPLYRGKTVVGYDISLRYVETVFERAFKNEVTYYHILNPRVSTLPFANKSFQAVVCSSVLLHQRPENIELVMSELSRVGKKVIVLTWAGRESPSSHCFPHDYDALLEKYTVIDKIKYKDQIYFVYVG